MAPAPEVPLRRKLLLTRPQAQSEAFAAELESRLPGRFDPVIAPVIAITPRRAPLDLTGAGGLLFTSANGVEQFAAATPDRSLPAWCVGAITAEAARAAGFDARSADGDVAALADLVIARHRPGDGVLLHVRGAHAAGDLTGRLAAAGLPARALELYDQIPSPIPPAAAALLAARAVPVLAFFSPRSAALFADRARAAGWDTAACTLVALSAAVAAALDALPAARRITAEAPGRDGMIAALSQV
jgi:uroporphyrinogen-III synthase